MVFQPQWNQLWLIFLDSSSLLYWAPLLAVGHFPRSCTGYTWQLLNWVEQPKFQCSQTTQLNGGHRHLDLRKLVQHLKVLGTSGYLIHFYFLFPYIFPNATGSFRQIVIITDRADDKIYTVYILSAALSVITPIGKGLVSYILLHKFWTGELVWKMDGLNLVSVVCEEMYHLKEKLWLVFPITNSFPTCLLKWFAYSICILLFDSSSAQVTTFI